MEKETQSKKLNERSLLDGGNEVAVEGMESVKLMDGGLEASLFLLYSFSVNS